MAVLLSSSLSAMRLRSNSRASQHTTLAGCPCPVAASTKQADTPAPALRPPTSPTLIRPGDWQIPAQYSHHNNAAHTSTHGRRPQGPVRAGTPSWQDYTDQWLTTLRQQVPQARLVACRWLVRSAQELARKHRHHAWCRRWNHSYGVERQRRERAQIQDARGMLAGKWNTVGFDTKVRDTDTFETA